MAITLTIDSVDVSAYIHHNSLKIEQSGSDFTAVLSFILNDGNSSLSISERDSVEVDDDGTTLYTGEIVDIEDVLMAVSHPGRRISITCRDNNMLVEEAVIDGEEVYNTSDSAILSDLFASYRSDINATTYVSTIATLEITFADITLRKALTEICARTGARWYVDEALNLHYFTTESNVASWYLSDRPNYVTTFGYQSIQKRRTATTIVNRILVVGQELRTWYQDSASVALYGVRPGPPVVDNRITTQDALDERGAAILAEWAYPKESYRVVTRKSGLRAGMDVRLVCTDWGVDETLTVLRQTIYWQDNTRFHQLELGTGIASALTTGQSFIDKLTDLDGSLNTVNGTVYDTDAPATPTFTSGNLSTGLDTADDGTQIVYIQATWGDVSDADLDHFQIQMSRSSDFSGYTVTRDHPQDGDRIERFEGVLGNTTYYFRVRAIDWVGNTSSWSSTQNIVSLADTTPPADPTGVSALATPASVHLTWNSNTEADLAEYEVQRKLDGGSYATIAKTRSTLLIDNNVDVGSTYWYQVRAVDTSGNASGYVEISSAVTVIAIPASVVDTAFGFVLDGILLKLNYNGPKPYNLTNIIDLTGNHGQVPATVNGGVIGRPGKYGKAVQIAEATTNLVTNPSFETTTSGWLASGTNTIAQTADKAFVGQYGLKVTYQDSTSLCVYSITLTATTHNGSVWVWVPPDWDGGDIYLDWVGYTGAAETEIQRWTLGTDPAGQWHRIIRKIIPDAGDLTGTLRVYTSSAPTVGKSIYIDAAQIEQNDYFTPYCDGSLGSGHTWSGTVHGSSSTRTAANIIGYNVPIPPVGSVSFWFYLDNNDEVTATNYLWLSTDNTNYWFVNQYPTSGSPGRLRVRCGGQATTLTTIPSILEWHHFAMIWNGSTYDVYIDGDISNEDVSYSYSALPSTFNISHTASGAVGALIDDFVLLDRELTPAEVDAIYRSNNPILDASEAYWVAEWQGWLHDMVFSATDHDTVAWTAGTITLRNGAQYSISSGNTGNISATTYIYLDKDTSETVLQTTTTAVTAVGANKLLIAVAKNVASGKDAMFQVYGSPEQSTFITAGNIAAGTITGDEIAANTIAAGNIVAGTITSDEIAANTITADEIAANTITADQIATATITANELAVNSVEATHINVATLSAISADMGTLTAGTVTGATLRTAATGARVVMDSTGLHGHSATTQTFEINTSSGTGYLGSSGGITWSSVGALSCVAMTAAGGNVFIGTAGVMFSSGAADTNGIVWKSSLPSGSTYGYIRVGASLEMDIVAGSAAVGTYPAITLRQQNSAGGGSTRTPIRVESGNLTRRIGLYSGGTPDATVHIYNPDSGSDGEDIPALKVHQGYTGGSNQPVALFDQDGGERVIFEIWGQEGSGSTATIRTSQPTTYSRSIKCIFGTTTLYIRGWV